MILGKARAASRESAANWDYTCGINKGNILPNVGGGFKMNRERRRNIFCKILKPKKNKNGKRNYPSATGRTKIYSIIQVILVRLSPYRAVTSLNINYKGSSVCACKWVSVTALRRMRIEFISFCLPFSE